MVRIRRFGIVRTANMVAALYAFIALIFAAFIVVFGALGVAHRPAWHARSARSAQASSAS